MWKKLENTRKPFFEGIPPACPAVLLSWSSSTTSSASTSGGRGWRSTSAFTSAGVHFHVHFWGVHFHVHFWGGPLLCSLQGGPLSCSLLGGPLPCSLPGGPLPCSVLGGSTSMFSSGGSTSMFTSRGVHFHVHFQGVPCDLSHNALIYCYRMPQYITGKIHMGPHQSLTD